MKIADFMTKKNYRPEDVAHLIGVSVNIVKSWMVGTNSPRLIHAIRLMKLSNGKIKLNEMLSTKDQILVKE